MSRGLVARRKRLVRVREAQHTLAVAERVRAEDEVRSITSNAERVARVRSELFAGGATELGASFAACRELADRLERAGRQLDGALYDARKVVTYKQGLQAEANREKEIALRLEERARDENEREREARLAAIPRYRAMRPRGQE